MGSIRYPGQDEQAVAAGSRKARKTAMEVPEPPPDEEYMLGPFHDLDGSEILPCTTEATDVAIESCIGNYRLCSNVPALHGKVLTINGHVVTRFIQHDWDRLMEDTQKQREQDTAGEKVHPAHSVGFLAAYEGKRRAVGRLAEDVICAEVFQEDLFDGDRIEKVYSVDDAIDAGVFTSSGEGVRCDDVVLITAAGRSYLGEVKASLSGRSYLLSSISKALQQFRNSLAVNPDIEGVVLTLVSIRAGDQFVVLIVGTRSEVEEQPDAHWRSLYTTLAPLRRKRTRHASSFEDIRVTQVPDLV